MNVSGQEILVEFSKKHADAIMALNRWYNQIRNTNCKTHAELKQLFPSVDYVGNSRYVFNIKGNNYRLVAIVVFIAGSLAIRYIGTHADYDKKDVSNI